MSTPDNPLHQFCDRMSHHMMDEAKALGLPPDGALIGLTMLCGYTAKLIASNPTAPDMFRAMHDVLRAMQHGEVEVIATDGGLH